MLIKKRKKTSQAAQATCYNYSQQFAQ